MIDGLGQLDVAKVTWTLRHVLIARLALELAIDGAEAGIVEAFFARLGASFVHGLWVLDMADTHVLDLFRRQQTKLHLFDRAQRRIRVRKEKIRHDELVAETCSLDACEEARVEAGGGNSPRRDIESPTP